MRRSRLPRSSQPGAGTDDDYADSVWVPPLDAPEGDDGEAIDGMLCEGWYAYGRGRAPTAVPETDYDDVPLDPGEIAAGVGDWALRASGLAYTERGLDRAFRLVEMAVAVTYLWFGVLKLFPSVSPAEELAGRTIEVLTAHLVPFRVGVVALGLFEVVLAGCLWWFSGRRWVLWLTLAQLGGTFAPFAVFPKLLLGRTPGSLTLAGQDIVKNLVLVTAVWATLQYHRAASQR